MADSNILSYNITNPEIDHHYQQIITRLSKLCRVCGDPLQNGINIFGNQGMESIIKEKIDIHMPIKINSDDMMPQKLCMDCYQKLEAVHNLVVMCLKTDMRFRKYLNIDTNTLYDFKFNKIARDCLIEVEQELCPRDNYEKSKICTYSNKSPSILKKTPQNEIIDNELRDLNESELPNDLTNLFQEFKADDNSNKVIIESNNKYAASKETDSIICINCKESFKSIDNFENHKILCDESNEIGNGSFEYDKPDKLLNEYSKSTDIGNRDCFNKIACENTPNDDNNEIVGDTNIKRRCGHCKVEYFTRKSLQNHINDAHEGKNLFMCGICDKVYGKWSGLDVHEATHRTDKPYLCDLCGKSFKHSNNLRGHKRIHLDECKKKSHVCEICHKRFRSRFHLREHSNSHSENRPYSCDECGKSFFKRVQLRQHKLSHGTNKFICKICEVSFNRRGNMMAHIKTHSKGEAVYTCSVCETKCKTMSELKLHRKQHTELDIAESIKKKLNNKPVWQCKLCSKMFLKQTVLLSHERTHTENKFSFECDECGKKLSSKNSLTYHKKVIHSKEKPHICQYCGDAYTSKEARLNHERIHTGERPYVCEICQARYRCSSNLSQHMKTHANVWSYICQFCEKGFTRKSTLNVHERTHTGEKPYSCSSCDRAFAQKNDMIKHSKTHSTKDLNCDQCAECFATKKELLKHQTEHQNEQQKTSVVHSYIMVPQLLDAYTLNIVHSDQLHVVQNA